MPDRPALREAVAGFAPQLGQAIALMRAAADEVDAGVPAATVSARLRASNLRDVAQGNFSVDEEVERAQQQIAAAEAQMARMRAKAGSRLEDAKAGAALPDTDPKLESDIEVAMRARHDEQNRAADAINKDIADKQAAADKAKREAELQAEAQLQDALSMQRQRQFESEGNLLDAELERLKRYYDQRLRESMSVTEKESLERTRALEEEATRQKYADEEKEKAVLKKTQGDGTGIDRPQLATLEEAGRLTGVAEMLAAKDPALEKMDKQTSILERILQSIEGQPRGDTVTPGSTIGEARRIFLPGFSAPGARS